MHRFAIGFAITLFVFPAFGAGMAHIVGVIDSHTLVIEQDGMRAHVTLAGVVVPPPDEETAADFLRRITSSGWVLVERDTAHRGEAWLYRSPDGLFVNGEMIRAAYRDGTTRMTYLGESSPGPRQTMTTKAPSAAPRKMSRGRLTHHIKR